QDNKVKKTRKGAILALVSLSHAMNHVQSGVFTVFYPLFREEFGIGYAGIGFLETTNGLVSGLLQVTYGFLARFVGRGVLLGIGNVTVGLAAAGMGFSRGYTHLVVWAAARSAGASAQHPVGAATLVSHYEGRRARVLGFHQAAGNIGSWAAPILASSLLLFLGWRQILWIIAVPSILMGLTYFAFRELVVSRPSAPVTGASQQSRARAGLADYVVILKDRNVIFLILAMLAGAAGRGTNVLSTYLTTYLVDTYQMDVSRAGFFFAAMMFGGIVGPLGVGWLADRLSHKSTAQFTLLAAAVFNFTVVLYPSANWMLVAHLMLAGVFMWARGPLIETLFTQATDKATLDSLLSIYYAVAFLSGPLWTMLIGIVIDRSGFVPAFALMATSYLIGMLFLAFVRFGPRKGVAEG
ncbi:MAG: MFS transporter, partial [Chloroflexota bacterium]|nr:MFS transporter [Chloroflexota bacterium]